MLEVKQIDVFYKVFQALREVSISVEQGETIGLFGPNGHGKTTILRTISGLQVPRRGSIEYNGRVISGISPERIVGMGIVHVLQGAHPFPEMTVMENLALGAYTSASWSARKDGLKKVFELFPRLKERRNQRCATLSGGERQMVAIGRSMMSSAKLLMLDEPFLGLAPNLSHEIMERILEIKESGISMIVVEQNVMYVARLSERLYLIEQGKAALEGKTDVVLANEYIREAYLGLVWERSGASGR